LFSKPQQGSRQVG